MIYLDYSATTPVDERVLDSYCKVTREYIGNANSIHTLGVKSKELLIQATNQIADIFKCHPKELIFDYKLYCEDLFCRPVVENFAFIV